jgi:hypothetical protein
MMITAEKLEAIAAEVTGLGLSEQSLQKLRSSHADIHFTYCMDDDVGVQQPYRSHPGFNIYLVDGREHCLKFTSELDHATGLVLAEVIADD